MELRAREDTLLAQDLIPAIPPIAASLHHRFLRSHCSACFRPLLHNSQNTPPSPNSCTVCNSSVSYCSPNCYTSDIGLHSSSGECHLIRLLDQSPPSTCHPAESSDVRTGLRLLETLGPLGSSSPRRICGLSLTDLDAVLSEGSGSEMAERIRQGAALMRRARKEKGAREEEVLWAVLTNAVEVQVSEGGALGIAVYGPWFSWFNHSCSPNACYRFELSSSSRSESVDFFDLGLFRVLPTSNGEVPEVIWKTWVYGGSNLTQGHQYGPRIVVRSVKPIKKGEEVCIAYTDLLQPKAMRHFDLWSKYRFMCSCERCNASPAMYVDYIFNSDAWSLFPNHDNSRDAKCDELAEFLDQTIAEYISDGNPEACCTKLENMLSGSFNDLTSQEPSKITFRLHPLHYLSLNAYIALSSACKILSTNLLATGSGEESTFKAFKMGRAAAAYSLLLAGATHHLFMSEPSLIASTTIFWISAGESIIGLLKSSCGVVFNLVSLHSQFATEEVSYASLDDCKETSIRFLKCISKNLTKSWPYLVEGFSYLENIRSPVDFSWLGITNICQILDGGRSATDFCLCCECKINVETCREEHRSLAQLAVCCLIYGRYLAIICWGQQSYLVDNVKNLFHDIG